MKAKTIFRNIKKIPLLCLIVVTIVVSDGFYDGILPWPSPFHLTLAHAEELEDTVVMADAGNRIPADTDGAAADEGPETTDVSETAEPSADAGTEADPADARIRDDHTNASAGDDHTNTPAGDDHANASAGDDHTNTPAGDDHANASAGDDHANTPAGDDHANAPAGDDHANTPAGDSYPDADHSGTSPDAAQTVLGGDGLPLVHYMQVEDDYFDDAVFIGDSRTRSLQLYANLENTTFLADTGLTIYTVLDKKLTPSTMTTKTTVTDYLTNHQFKKIYLMLGINEVGTGTAESFCRSYGKVLETLRELQPDAIIYIQAILHISEGKDKEHTYINNAAIIERNEALQSLVDNEHIFWLDSNPAICDENGYLIDSYTFDGVHLQAKYVYLWTDYLKQHAIRQDVFPVSQSPFPAPQPQAIP